MATNPDYTDGEMERILLQLDRREQPFKSYGICRSEDGQGLAPILGKGGFGVVYPASKRGKKKQNYVIKVIGFGRHGTIRPEDSRCEIFGETGSQELRNSRTFFSCVYQQRELAEMQENIVQVFAMAEVRLWLDGEMNIAASKVFFCENDMRKAEEAEGGRADYIDERNLTMLDLQFVVMERLIPIVAKDQDGKMAFRAQPMVENPQKEIITMAYDISLALTYVYEKSEMLHRDVKPENIFYDPKKKVYKLGDFGIAIQTFGGLTGKLVRGSGVYASPEMREK